MAHVTMSNLKEHDFKGLEDIKKRNMIDGVEELNHVEFINY